MTEEVKTPRRSLRLPGGHRTRRAVGAIACCVVLVGAGVGIGAGIWAGDSSPHATSAAPPAAVNAVAAAKPTLVPVASVTNLTPYTWHLTLDQGQEPHPPETVVPGQTASFNATDTAQVLCMVMYDFYDNTGIEHEVALAMNPWTGLVSHSLSGTKTTRPTYSTAYFHMQGDPDGSPSHVDAVWNTPTTIKIDSATDPSAATTAVKYELLRATTFKWTPAPGATPQFEWGPSTRATSKLFNFSSAPAKLVKGHETSKGQSTSLGLEITASLSAKILGRAAGIAVTVTGDHEWGSSDSVTVDVDTEVGPHQVGWLEKRVSVATLKGELVFTTPEGTTFDITNVSISRGDIVPPDHTVKVGMDFTPNEIPLTTPPSPAHATTTAP